MSFNRKKRDLRREKRTKRRVSQQKMCYNLVIAIVAADRDLKKAMGG